MPKQFLKSTLTLAYLFYSFSAGAADPQFNERLRNGEIITDGGYREDGTVWARMDAVIKTPPEVVWGLFIDTNRLKDYGIPNLRDAKAISAKVAEKTLSLKKVEEVYQTIGTEIYNPAQDRRPDSSWVHHCFQYFDFPWPVANKWFVLKQINDETRAMEDNYKITWGKFSGNVNTIDGVMTYTRFEGNPNLTHFHQEITTDPNSHVPKFLLKWGVKRSMPAAAEAIRREALKAYKQSPPLLKTNR